MSLAFMEVLIGLGFSKSRIVIGLLLMIAHPVGGAEPIVGTLQTERYGGQIIEEMERDYPTLNLYKGGDAKWDRDTKLSLKNKKD